MRRAEMIVGCGGLLLLAAVFFLPWFAARAAGGKTRSSLDGWQALTTSRWILLLTILISVAVVLLTVSRRAPAMPVGAGMLACVFGVVASLLLLYRIVEHAGLTARAGLYIGLLATLAVAYGGFLSLRTEGGSPPDPRTMETVAVGDADATSTGETEPTSVARPGP